MLTTVTRSPVVALRVKFGSDSNGNRTVTARRAEARGIYVRRQLQSLDSYNGDDYEMAAEAVALLLDKLGQEYEKQVGTVADCPWSAGGWTLARANNSEFVAVRSPSPADMDRPGVILYDPR